MGAFWDAWNKQGAANNADAMAGMQQAQGLAALMKQGQEAQMAQGIRGILSSNQPAEAKLQGLMQFGPAGIQVASQMAQMQGQQAKLAEETRLRELRPQLQAMFTTPAIEPEMGPPVPGTTLNPGKPAGFDETGYIQRAATEGLVAPETAFNHLAQQRLRKDQLIQQGDLAREKMQETTLKANEDRISRDFQAEENRKARLAQIQAAIAGRTPAAAPAPIIKETPEGIFERARDGTWKQVINPTTGKPMLGKPEEKTVAAQEGKKAGKQEVTDVLSELKEQYELLKQGSGITDPKGSALSNARAFAEASGPGQLVGKIVGSDNQSARNEIALKRPLLLTALKKSLGLSAQMLNSNAELKLWLQTATDPTLDIQANMSALANLDRMYGNGTLFEGGEQPKPRVSGGKIGAPSMAPKRPVDVMSEADKILKGQ